MEEEVTPKVGSHRDVWNPENIPWLHNWSDWQGWQHRRLLRAANTLAPPLRIGLLNIYS